MFHFYFLWVTSTICSRWTKVYTGCNPMFDHFGGRKGRMSLSVFLLRIVDIEVRAEAEALTENWQDFCLLRPIHTKHTNTHPWVIS